MSLYLAPTIKARLWFAPAQLIPELKDGDLRTIQYLSMVRTASFGPSSISIAGEGLYNLLALYTQDVRAQASVARRVALSVSRNSKIHCHTKDLLESIPPNRAVSYNKQGG